jgi:hypothetical protein
VPAGVELPPLQAAKSIVIKHSRVGKTPAANVLSGRINSFSSKS